MPNFERGSRGSYMSQFLHLKCAGDVLNALGHPVSEPEREITRAMACLRLLRVGVKAPPRKPNPRLEWDKTLAPLRLIQLGANPALAVLAAHILPYQEVLMISEEVIPPTARLFDVSRLSVRRGNIYQNWIRDHIAAFNTPVVLASAHATPQQAERAIELYKTVPKVEQVVLLLDHATTWQANGTRIPSLLAKDMGWSTGWAIANAISLKADVFRDTCIPKGQGPRVMFHLRSHRIAPRIASWGHRDKQPNTPLVTLPVTVEESDGGA